MELNSFVTARIRRMGEGNIFSLCVSLCGGGGVPTLDREEGTYLGLDRGGVPTLDGGRGTYLGQGRGYLPWTGEGGTYLGQGRGYLGYLGWRRGYLPWTEGRSTYIGWGRGGTYLRCWEGYLPWTGGGVPNLDGVDLPTLDGGGGTLDKLCSGWYASCV